MPSCPSELLDIMRHELAPALRPDLAPLLQVIEQRFGGSLQAVLFYGAALRQGVVGDAMVDFYVIVRDYQDAYEAAWERWANRLLPPNVYYLQTEDGALRAKYAVFSLPHLKRLSHGFLPQVWGRLVQPMQLLMVASSMIQDELAAIRADAVLTFLYHTLPLAPAHCTIANLWHSGLAASYRTELRPEGPQRIVALLQAALPRLDRLTRAAAPALPMRCAGELCTSEIGRWHRCAARLLWLGRMILGKLANIMRLAKATLTFQGGIDYAVWKIQRHTGHTIAITPRLRRHPVLLGFPRLIALWWRGLLR